MHRLGGWLWQRRRDRFVGWLTAVTTALVIVGLFTPAVTIGSAYLGLSLEEGLVWGLASVATTIVSQLVVLRSMHRLAAPIRRWAAGDRGDARTTWIALVRLPQTLGTLAGWYSLPFHGATSLPVAILLARPGAAGVIGLLVAYPVVAVTCALLSSTAAQLLARAATDDVAAHTPPVEVLEGTTWSVRTRLFTAVLLVGTLCAAAAPPIVLGGAVTETDYPLVLLGGGAFAIYMALIVDAGLLQPMLSPLRDVVAATARVRVGDASVPVPVSTFDELGDLAAGFNQMQRGLRERASLHAAFGSYVDPALAQRLVESGSSIFDGEDVVVSVLFADVRDFTALSEGITPAEAVALLNRLFDVVVPVLHDHGGHANHYLGDGLLAIFGAPSSLERHADAAVAAAVEMQRGVLDTFGGALRLGIGINTGPVIAGTVGGGGRHEFTVIGDTVNVAARVEQLTKQTGDGILITDATRRSLSDPASTTSERGAFDLKGKAAAVTVHAVAAQGSR